MVASLPRPFLGLFLVEESTLHLAILPLQLAVLAHVLDGYGKVLGCALIGAGATRAAMQLTLLPQWLLFLPLLAVVVHSGFGLAVAMAVLAASTTLSALLFVRVWQREDWSSIEL